jgi:hypothetical protein
MPAALANRESEVILLDCGDFPPLFYFDFLHHNNKKSGAKAPQSKKNSLDRIRPIVIVPAHRKFQWHDSRKRGR